ncbi:MAG: phosphatase PAP2 family protein [Rikenellaceae bacterium]
MWDHDLFLWLNFDGGALLDSLMLFVSGKISWLPLYILILWLIWRRCGWRGMLISLAAFGLAAGLSDIIAGIFKHSGLLKNLLPEFPVRLRPMHTPELEGLVHWVKMGGQNGTVSAHAATSISVGVIATLAIQKRWFTAVMWTQVALVCYSRIYLGYHFPQDILLGALTGVTSGVVMWFLLRKFILPTDERE